MLLDFDLIDPASFASLETRLIGRPLTHVASTGSTNDDLKQVARLGAPEGMVLSTDLQTEGRGRRGRQWSAPPGSSLLLSTLLRPTWLPVEATFLLTIMLAVAGAEAIEAVTGLRPGLKWPNDLQIDGRKVGGILVETEIAGGTLRWAVAGIGVNCNWDPAVDPELAATATSLAAATGRPVARAVLLRALLLRLDGRYACLRRGARDALFDAWRSRLTTLGQVVRVEAAGEIYEGLAEAVTEQGALVVRDERGQRREFTAGEVTLRRREQ